MTKARTTGFTLIEMLTVIVIIGIVLAMGIPAFTNLMKSGGLSAAARQVSSTLSLARQYAITHRTTTRVVFPYRATTGAGTNLAPLYQSYAVLNYGATPNYLTKWEHLPLGTVFMDGNNLIIGAQLSVDNNLGTTPASMPFPYASSPPATLAYIEFTPWGAASQSGSFTITEGIMNGGTVTPTSRSNITAGVGILVNVVTVSVDNVVGRIQVTRP